MTAMAANFTTTLIWIVVSFSILTFANRKWKYNLFQTPENTNKTGVWVSVFLVFVVTAMMFMIWEGFKPWLEYQKKIALLGEFGWISFILQNIYYVFEMLLALIMVAFGQHALDTITLKRNIPWGGFILGVMWGLPHIFTKNMLSGWLFFLVLGVILGLPYILTNRNAKLAWLFMTVMFIL